MLSVKVRSVLSARKGVLVKRVGCCLWVSSLVAALCFSCASPAPQSTRSPTPKSQAAAASAGEALEPDKPQAAANATPEAAHDREPASELPAQLADLPSGTKLLHVGDSFAGALGYELNRLLKEHGVSGTLKYEKSTYIPTWASNRDFAAHLQRYQPHVVLITLGGNELKIPDPNARAETVRRVVKRVGGVPCVWIGIPLWEGANPALMEVVRQNVAPCLFLDSTALLPKLERARDGIHPSTAGRTTWAETVVVWLREQLVPGAGAWKWRTDAQNH